MWGDEWARGCTVNGKHFVPFHRINVHLLVFHVPGHIPTPASHSLSHSLSPESRRGGGCVCVWFNFAKGILRTDVYWRQVLLTYLLLLQFSQLTNAFVRFRNCYRFGTWGKGTPCHSSSCSSIVHRNSRFHLIMGIVRIYVMTLFRIHLHHEPPRDDL